MRLLIVLCLVFSCSLFDRNSGDPREKLSYSSINDIPIPLRTTPYNKNMCRAKRFIKAYSFVLKGVEFDKKGCITPIESWIFDSNRGKWVYIDAHLVRCCNPLKGFKRLSL